LLERPLEDWCSAIGGDLSIWFESKVPLL